MLCNKCKYAGEGFFNTEFEVGKRTEYEEISVKYQICGSLAIGDSDDSLHEVQCFLQV